MIVVTVQMWPKGDSSKARELGRMTIANQGGLNTASRADYDVRLMRRGTTDTVLRTGTVENYPRLSYPVWALVLRALTTVFS